MVYEKIRKGLKKKTILGSLGDAKKGLKRAKIGVLGVLREVPSKGPKKA